MLHQRILADALPRGASFGRVGQLEVRLAAHAAEIAEAQALRYEIFFEEMGAVPYQSDHDAGLDVDPHDAVCDHLLVIDHDAGGRIVGTYRLLRQDIASAHGGFYSANEFDLSPLIASAWGEWSIAGTRAILRRAGLPDHHNHQSAMAWYCCLSTGPPH